MIAVDTLTHKTDVFYPSEDGEPLAETYDHVYAIMATMLVLKEYLKTEKRRFWLTNLCIMRRVSLSCE